MAQAGIATAGIANAGLAAKGIAQIGIGAAQGGFTYSGGDDNRYMFFATRNREPSGTLLAASAGTAYVATKIKVSTPQYVTHNFRFHFSGFACTESTNSPQETVLPGNDTVIDQLWVKVGEAGTYVQAAFSSSPGVTITSGTDGAWSDDIDLGTVASQSDIFIFLIYHTASVANQIPVYRVQTQNDERAWSGVDLPTVEAFLTNDLAASTPALVANYSTVSQVAVYGPDLMVGKGWDGRPVVLGSVDSIGEARNEFSGTADARGNMGWLRRWLDTAGYYGRIPHFMIGVPGASCGRELSTNSTMRWDILDQAAAFNTGNAYPFTTILMQMGQNDTNASYSFWWNAVALFLARLRARYPLAKLVESIPFGRTDSTDGWATLVNQTYSAENVWPAVAGDDTTGKWELRDDILANRSSLQDGSIDTFVPWGSSVTPAFWVPNETVDGIHPSPASAVRIAQAESQQLKAGLIISSNIAMVYDLPTASLISLPQGAFFQRAGAASEYTSTGTLVSADPNAPRPANDPVTGDSLNAVMCEPAGVQYVKNSNWSSVVAASNTATFGSNSNTAGTWGTMPSSTSFSVFPTITSSTFGWQIASAGVYKGRKYIDLRVQWHNGEATNQSFFFAFQPSTSGVTASSSDTFTQSADLSLVAGSATGLLKMRIRAINGTTLGASIDSAALSVPAFPVLAKFTNTGALSGTVSAVTSGFTMTLAASGTVDFTVRIMEPQLEKAAKATSPMPSDNSVSALPFASRAADLWSLSNVANGNYNVRFVTAGGHYDEMLTAAGNVLALTAPTQMFTDGVFAVSEILASQAALP